MINKDELVVLKGTDKITMGQDIFKPHHFYRHSIMPTGHLVWGVHFTNTEFYTHFELAHTRVLRDFTAIGILPPVNPQPISKTLFTHLADIHVYGTGRKALKVWYFGTKQCRYGFYPMQGNQRENQAECYQYYCDLISGDMTALDDKEVKFGNCGIPLVYSELRIS